MTGISIPTHIRSMYVPDKDMVIFPNIHTLTIGNATPSLVVENIFLKHHSQPPLLMSIPELHQNITS